jgi:nitrate reductase gamma subunit
LLTAAVALGVGEVVAAFVRPAAAPVIVVGNRFILLTPEPVKRWAIRNVGTNDKTLLLSGIYIGIAVFAVVVGLLALRRLVYGLIGIAVFGVVGAYAALSTNAHRGSDVVPTIFGTLAALAVLEAFAIDAVAGPTVAARRLVVPMVTFFRFTMDDVALLLNTAVATGVALAGADKVPMTSAEDMAATTPAAVQRRWFTDILKSPLCWEPERARWR